MRAGLRRCMLLSLTYVLLIIWTRNFSSAGNLWKIHLTNTPHMYMVLCIYQILLVIMAFSASCVSKSRIVSTFLAMTVSPLTTCTFVCTPLISSQPLSIRASSTAPAVDHERRTRCWQSASMSSAMTAFGHAMRRGRGSVPSAMPPLASMTTIGFTSPSSLARWGKVATGTYIPPNHCVLQKSPLWCLSHNTVYAPIGLWS